jgi:hypothetical protein
LTSEESFRFARLDVPSFGGVFFMAENAVPSDPFFLSARLEAAGGRSRQGMGNPRPAAAIIFSRCPPKGKGIGEETVPSRA